MSSSTGGAVAGVLHHLKEEILLGMALWRKGKFHLIVVLPITIPLSTKYQIVHGTRTGAT